MALDMAVWTGKSAINNRGPAAGKKGGNTLSLTSLVPTVLTLLGRPFFYLLLFIFIAVYQLIAATGTLTLSLLKALLSLPKIRPPQIPPLRIRLPTIPLPLFWQRRTLFPGVWLAKATTWRPKISISLPRISPVKTLFFFSLLLATGVLIYFFYLFILKDLPQPDRLITRTQALSTKIYDRNGKLLYKIYRNQNRTLLPLDEIPLVLRQATIAIEDKEFYRHAGFSPSGILRAFWRNLFQENLSGGSTITQQLVKNALLSPERTWQRKIKEAILAIQVEAYFSKDEILQMYLNEVGYGGAAYGIEEAARTYFGKSARDLNLDEAALLAGLPASPTRYSPFGAHPQLAKARQEQVLTRMAEDGYLTREEAEAAKKGKLVFAPQGNSLDAPHFVMYVKDLLVREYGERLVEEGGLEATTSLDLTVQAQVERIVREEITKLRPLRISNGAALVTNPKTGEILAMVGSKDYFNQEEQGNFNVTTALRQPGSAIKPINYALALENGFTAATVIPDSPITYQIPGQKPYSPSNYDNRYHGNVPLRVALASSYNVPAVKVLSSLGVARMIEQGQKMGISTWEDPSRFGLSLTLGGGEVKMTEMAVVYATLANLGQKVDLHPLLEIKDSRGKTLQKLDCRRQEKGFPFLNQPSPGEYCQPETAIDPQVAYILTDILSDNSARTPAFGPNSVLVVPEHSHIAVKTGTTNNLKDNWTIGYSPDFLTAVWVGNNDNTPMSYVASGITGASPIWQKIMIFLLKDTPDKDFSQPPGIEKVEICTLTGTLPCEGCPKRMELFKSGSKPQTGCNPEAIKEVMAKTPENPR